MVAWNSSAHQQNLAHLFSDTETCVTFFLALLIAKYNQLRSGDQKENMGRSYYHVGIQLPQGDQTSAVPPSRVCNTCSREEKKQVRVIGFNITTLGAVEKKPGTIPSPSVCPSGFTASLLPQKYRTSWETCSLGNRKAQLSRLGLCMAGFRTSPLHPIIGNSSFP